jgi:hypothetical protein
VPRALTLNRTIVPLPDRERFMTRARALKSHFQSRGCQYWVFEDKDVAGAFIEFAEGKDADLLVRAFSDAPEPHEGADGEPVPPVPERIYREVSL